MLKLHKKIAVSFLVVVFSVSLLLLSYVRADESLRIIDNFDEIYNWQAISGEGTFLELTNEEGYKGDSLCLNYTLAEENSYVVVTRDIELNLPSDFKITFYIKGDSPDNNLEFKLLDNEGNVFWKKWDNYQFSKEWQKITLYKKDIPFAWGPNPEAQLNKIVRIEIAISASTGGQGKVFIDELTLSAL